MGNKNNRSKNNLRAAINKYLCSNKGKPISTFFTDSGEAPTELIFDGKHQSFKGYEKRDGTIDIYYRQDLIVNAPKRKTTEGVGAYHSEFSGSSYRLKFSGESLSIDDGPVIKSWRPIGVDHVSYVETSFKTGQEIKKIGVYDESSERLIWTETENKINPKLLEIGKLYPDD